MATFVSSKIRVLTRYLATGCILLLSVCYGQAQVLDLSGDWRMTEADDPLNALPQTNDSQWQTLRLPRGHERLTGTYWLRKTVTIPESADTLVVGRQLTSYTLYLNGVPAPTEGRLAQIPASLRGALVTIAIRSAFTPLRSPLFGAMDTGPWLAAPAKYAQEALEAANDRFLVASRPRVFLAGVSFTVGLVLIATWAFGELSSWLLFWVGVYQFGQALTIGLGGLLGLGDQSGSLLAAGAFLQLSLVAIRWDVPWTRVGGFGGLILSNVLLPAALPVWTVALSACTVAGAGVVLARNTVERQRAFAIALLLGSTAYFGRFGGTWTEFRGGIWPVNALLTGIVPAIALVAFELWRLRNEQRHKRRLATEIEAARSAQQMLIAQEGPAGLDVCYLPASEVGGDFWQAYTLPDGSILMAVGDVSGKGLHAAMLVALITGILDNRRSNQPAELLRELNRALCGRMQGGFVTACVACIGSDGQTAVAAAGPPVPYCEGEALPLEPGLPLGIDPDAEYGQSAVELKPGQQLTFVSDGIVEAANAKGELFGFDRTAAVSAKSALEIAEAARAWGQNDDITVVTVRRASA